MAFGWYKIFAHFGSAMIDAFVYDEQILKYLTKSKFLGRVRVLPETFDEYFVSIALQDKSPLRKPINMALLEFMKTENWTELRNRYVNWYCNECCWEDVFVKCTAEGGWKCTCCLFQVQWNSFQYNSTPTNRQTIYHVVTVVYVNGDDLKKVEISSINRTSHNNRRVQPVTIHAT